MKKKICIAAGGTGGHIYPALALADLWKQKDPDLSVVFIGSDDRMEKDLIPARGYPFHAIHASGLEGSLLHKLKALIQVWSARSKARAYLKEEKPDLVIGFGGYVSAPVMMAARSLGIPVMVHEQNSVIGKSNRLAARNADAIVTCYQKAQDEFGPKARLLGNPRATVAAHAKADEAYFRSLGLDPNKKTILIVMGSLGSSSVNELMKDALKGLDESLQVLYVCGKANSQNLNLFEGQKNIHAAEFVDTMSLYPLLDGMICRAGATTIAELTALGIPSILIPSPYVAENHQYYNAKMLADKGAACMIEEKDLNAATLKKAIEDSFLNEDNRQALAKNARAMGKPQAAWDMIDWASQLMEGRAGDGK